MVLGIISDTHGVVEPVVYELFAGVDAIIHGGDIGGDDVIVELEAIAPVFACSGNIDGFETSGHPVRMVTKVSGLKIGATHIGTERGSRIGHVEEWVAGEALDLFVYGHSHYPRISRWGNTLAVNPGSAGPKRFSLPRAVARVSHDNGTLDAEILTFG